MRPAPAAPSASARAARAAPDGYTISLGQNGSHVITGATYNNLSYDLLKDFEPLSLLCIAPFVITGKKDHPGERPQELHRLSQGQSGQGNGRHRGSGQHHPCLRPGVPEAHGTRLQFVPYRGTAPAMQDLVAGQIDMMISDPVTSMPQARGRHHQGLCGRSRQAPAIGAGGADRG